MTLGADNDLQVAEARIEARACRHLWCAVLLAQYETVFPGKFSRKTYKPKHWETTTVMAAKRWFGSRYFETVCALAGVDHDFVLDKFNSRLEEVGQL